MKLLFFIRRHKRDTLDLLPKNIVLSLQQILKKTRFCNDLIKAVFIIYYCNFPDLLISFRPLVVRDNIVSIFERY
jgi:hypothetical protein